MGQPSNRNPHHVVTNFLLFAVIGLQVLQTGMLARRPTSYLDLQNAYNNAHRAELLKGLPLVNVHGTVGVEVQNAVEVDGGIGSPVQVEIVR
jgi:hypothetical protein